MGLLLKRVTLNKHIAVKFKSHRLVFTLALFLCTTDTYVRQLCAEWSQKMLKYEVHFYMFSASSLNFYARRLYRQVLLRARIIAMAIMSVCLSAVSRPGTESIRGQIETPGFIA